MAADLQIPQALQNEVENWISQFKANFRHLGDRPVDQPVWSDGFDEMAWLDRGHALAELLGALSGALCVLLCGEACGVRAGG
ncbi:MULTISPECIES: hypothetical protein [Dietzia]|uniref:Acyl-CoA dehydrogenase n=1 Tax=Dietzia cinnamea TaxID=321318 RepID=A0AAW5QE24_9ACTN|nr:MULTISPECIES: hypothetical protein [Dietzia]MBM7232045.1 hypothetical protein [Dietzia cinnamea]MCT1865700.1 hypothetical protein [Dietzia cinnamea]MCT1886846.1 hypothetical protein [Dietzia cinnamea]MCT2031801.1 hypothetical protein [Dietzia cinnamea]MCT2035202.1 hypothetical protein [Dietzia cinnamea]